MARLFALPLGADFAVDFVRGFLARFGDRPPEALARITIHANSQRMRRRISEALQAEGVRLLPRLRLVSDLAEDPILADLPPAAPALRRRLQLNQLIRALIARAPDLARPSAVQDLTESLFALMEEMDSEGIEPAALAGLDVSEHSAHWARSQQFLNILVPFFAQSAQRGTAARQRIAALRLAEMWTALPPADPVIVAGSTASRGAISTFMEAVARLPEGFVVLPGFDFDLPGPVWQAMEDQLTSEDHPQYRFLRLAERLGLQPQDVQPWGAARGTDAGRNAVMALALRPAPVTDQWLVEGAALTDLPGRLGRMTLVEAASPRDEAQALAVILRAALERGQTAALVTPDRLLTRRVTAALDRWGIRPDDSAGRPLILSAPGRFLRHVADLCAERLTAARLLVLLKHPMVMSGAGRGLHLLLTRELELHLRRHGPVFPTGADLIRWALDRREAEAGQWARALATVLDGLALDPGPMPLAERVARHVDLAETLARGLAPDGAGALWLEAPGEACHEIAEALAAEAPHGGEVTALDYRDLFAALLAERAVPETLPTHPLQILGAREARECGADLVILAGLNEGAWPSMPAPDPWLNRALRKEAGLLLPERQIGLSAHDFQQAAAAGEVVLSRALRSDESETVAARWVNRLLNLVAGLPGGKGPEALEEMRGRGQGWLNLAQALDRPGAAEQADPGLRPARRPRPVPPAQARPERLSLTDLERLIRDPYAIYAKRVLGLRPLEALNAEPDAGDRGTVFHRVLELFVKERPEGEEEAAAKARLLATAERVLGEEMPFPVHRALWQARFLASAEPILAEDRRAGETLAVERNGKAMTPAGVELYGRLDRVDRRADGRLVLIDYKTGKLPSAKEQTKFALQLLATAVLADRGGFALPGPVDVGEIRYVGVSEAGKVVATELDGAAKAEVWARLVKLLAHYRDGETGFTARRAPQMVKDAGDYDHLARLGEWTTADFAASQPVGDHDAG